MPALDSLPPDQRAVLSLVLKQGKSYTEIAALLGIDEDAVRQRAHAALGALAPREGAAPPPARREALSDYLLNQQGTDETQRTRNYLASSASGRAWARIVAGELRPLGDGRLPEIPGESGASDSAGAEPAAAVSTPVAPAAAAAPVGAFAGAPPAAGMSRGADASAAGDPERGGAASAARDPRSSRRAGAILLGIVAAAVIVLIVVLTTGGGGGGKRRTAVKGSTGPTAGQPQIIGQVNLKSTSGSKTPIGIALIVVQANQPYLGLQAQGLAAAPRGSYGVWLYNSHSSAYPIGSAPAVSANGRLSAIAPLPATTGNYRAVIITREHSQRPTTPGQIILSGPLPGHTPGH